jgi:hypothetical protein
LMLICLAISVMLLFLASRLKWWIPTKDLQPGRCKQTVSNE